MRIQRHFYVSLIATTFGDPHLVTLDGFSYTFNGHGEYTILNIDEIGFKFQARMQPLKTKGKNTRGTFLMAFVLTDDHSDTVQVGLTCGYNEEIVQRTRLFKTGQREIQISQFVRLSALKAWVS